MLSVHVMIYFIYIRVAFEIAIAIAIFNSVVIAIAVALAIVGSATAFSPMMSMETSRRQVYDCDRNVFGAPGRQ